MDSARIEIIWNNLRAIVTEQSRVLQATAFSPVVREAGDHASALFDTQGRMIAQADIGTPGHINSLAACGHHLIRRFPAETLDPGDILVTNDPWLGAGHLFDVTVLRPIYFNDRLVAFVGSTIHHNDVGGYGHGAGARDVYEEGLWMPPLKLYEAGEPNATLHAIIRQNVRQPHQFFGDLSAQISGARVATEKLISLLRRQKLEDLDEAGGEILRRSETAMRDAIRKLKPGSYLGESRFDVPGGAEILLKACLHVDAEAGKILVDFEGSSLESEHGINVVLNYTHAYTTFAVRATLTPDLPNNWGSMLPVKVSAPLGSILNCEQPAPVNARATVGMYVSMPVIKALHNVAADAVIAESAGAPYSFHIHGHNEDGSVFPTFMYAGSGGLGARRSKPGLSTTGFPTGIKAVPLEVLEAKSPIVFIERQLREGSGGDGLQRGGEGQRVKFRIRTNQPWILNPAVSRTARGPEGLEGGACGAPGSFNVDGVATRTAGKIVVPADGIVEYETAGGGGFGAR